MTGAVATRLARETDVVLLAALLGDMERHYRSDASVPPHKLAARLRLALFGPRPAAEALIASIGGAPAGFAFFCPFFPTPGGGTGALLKDIYVPAPARRRGVARALIGALAREAVARGWDRIDFSTGLDNAAARATYAALRVPLNEHVPYRIEGSTLARLAAQS